VRDEAVEGEVAGVVEGALFRVLGFGFVFLKLFFHRGFSLNLSFGYFVHFNFRFE
jgi:hypothetical protein